MLWRSSSLVETNHTANVLQTSTTTVFVRQTLTATVSVSQTSCQLLQDQSSESTGMKTLWSMAAILLVISVCSIVLSISFGCLLRKKHKLLKEQIAGTGNGNRGRKLLELGELICYVARTCT